MSKKEYGRPIAAGSQNRGTRILRVVMGETPGAT
jgi:hypothetical protein